MTVTTITLHYQSPPKDPFKVPRPHRITLDEHNDLVAIKGGEVGEVTDLIGFSRTLRLAFQDPHQWQSADALYDEDDDGPLIEGLKGWHPAFMGPRGPFSMREKISRIEITP
jgi:hypothetical protein